MGGDDSYRAHGLRFNHARAENSGTERGGRTNRVDCQTYGIGLSIREMNVIRSKFLLASLVTLMFIMLFALMMMMSFVLLIAMMIGAR